MNKKQMDKLNLSELKALAKEQNLKGYSTMTKPALLSHLSGGSMIGGAMGGYGDKENFNYFNVDQMRTYVKGLNPKAPVTKLNQNELIEIAQGKKELPTKTKREPNAWVKALAIYNDKKPVYTIPKKGTKEHKRVQNIMNGKPEDFEIEEVKTVEVKAVESEVKPKKTRNPRVKKQ
jgi:hypothetical protein